MQIFIHEIVHIVVQSQLPMVVREAMRSLHNGGILYTFLRSPMEAMGKGFIAFWIAFIYHQYFFIYLL